MGRRNLDRLCCWIHSRLHRRNDRGESMISGHTLRDELLHLASQLRQPTRGYGEPTAVSHRIADLVESLAARSQGPLLDDGMSFLGWLQDLTEAAMARWVDLDPQEFVCAVTLDGERKPTMHLRDPGLTREQRAAIVGTLRQLAADIERSISGVP